jgi:uncharacterized repeat protein (TIGR01451 family)
MKKTLSVLFVLSLVVLSGCPCLQKERVQTPPPRPAPRPVAAPKPVVVQESVNTVSRIYPCAGCGVIRVDKKMPEEVQLNSPFDYTITLTNLTDMELHDIRLVDYLPDGYHYKSSRPSAEVEDGVLTWMMDSLEGKAVEEIVVSGMATSEGWVETCANVTYVIPACAKSSVVRAALALKKTAPKEVLLCDEIPLNFVVTNTGSGEATNVKIMDELPDGLFTTDGKSSVNIGVGTLAVGKSATYKVMAKAGNTGTYRNSATASATGGLKAESGETVTKVTQPVLTITKTGSERLYLGRQLRYDITVSNKGDAAATDTVIEDTVPTDVEGIKTNAGGKLVGSKLVWEIGDLAAGASKTVSVAYTPKNAGTFSNKATVKAYCADAVSASAKTMVEGIAAILLEVIDVSDPIEVGQNETYVITVTNQGSAPGTKIVVACMLEDSMSYVLSSGATSGTLTDGVVEFDALGSLAPKAKATWRVVVKAVKAGDVRFTVTMKSDELGRDVQETEATNFYE